MRQFFLSALISGFLLPYPAFSAATDPAQVLHGNPLMSSSHIVARVVELLQLQAVAAGGSKHPPRYVSIGLDQDEYIYSILDNHFIRLIKKRFELPSWRHCGDWAQVRVEAYDDNMRRVGPVDLWVFVFRQERWERVTLDQGGLYRKQNLDEAELPPYAARCFNLDHRELTDAAE